MLEGHAVFPSVTFTKNSREIEEFRNVLAKTGVPGQVVVPYMGKTFRITFNSLDLGQSLDGLRARAEAWRNTAKYLDTGQSPDEFFVCEECRDADEATNIADHYDRIIALIERQVREQGGWR